MGRNFSILPHLRSVHKLRGCSVQIFLPSVAESEHDDVQRYVLMYTVCVSHDCFSAGDTFVRPCHCLVGGRMSYKEMPGMRVIEEKSYDSNFRPRPEMIAE